MSYSWQSITTDRTANSYYNFSDVNRVNNNTEYLREYINDNLGTYVIFGYTFTAKNVNSFGRQSLINGLENNINSLVTYLGYQPAGWATLSENWTDSNKYDFIYTNANNLEVDLNLIKEDVEERVGALIKCGESVAICGKIPERFEPL